MSNTCKGSGSVGISGILHEGPWDGRSRASARRARMLDDTPNRRQCEDRPLALRVCLSRECWSLVTADGIIAVYVLNRPIQEVQDVWT